MAVVSSRSVYLIMTPRDLQVTCHDLSLPQLYTRRGNRLFNVAMMSSVTFKSTTNGQGVHLIW